MSNDSLSLSLSNDEYSYESSLSNEYDENDETPTLEDIAYKTWEDVRKYGDLYIVKILDKMTFSDFFEIFYLD